MLLRFFFSRIEGRASGFLPGVASFLFCVATVCVAKNARAVDPFEIQVYDGTANRPKQFGLETHWNDVAMGRKIGDAPELPSNHVMHLTFEPSYGLTDWWELGAYIQSAMRPDGSLDFAGVKLRSKFVTPPAWSEHFRLGLNLELSAIPETYDRGVVGGELRPILAYDSEHLLLAANPIVDIGFENGGASDGPIFEPAATAVLKIPHVLGVGAEYYGGLGPFSGFLPVRQQEHYVYEVFHVLSEDNIELRLGVGEGLTDASNPLVFSVILGTTFETSVGTNSRPPSPLPVMRSQ